jgi:hypothetical protein
MSRFWMSEWNEKMGGQASAYGHPIDFVFDSKSICIIDEWIDGLAGIRN